MNLELYIDVDEAVLYAKKVLGSLQDNKARIAVRTAINKTAKQIKKLDEKAAKKIFTAPKDQNPLGMEKATTANLEAILRDKGGSVGITHFIYSWSENDGIEALINKNNGYKKITLKGRKSFISGMHNGGWGVFARESKKRLPIKKMKSISSPSAHGAPDVWDKSTEPQGAKLFYKNLELELVRILNLI